MGCHRIERTNINFNTCHYNPCAEDYRQSAECVISIGERAKEMDILRELYVNRILNRNKIFNKSPYVNRNERKPRCT